MAAERPRPCFLGSSSTDRKQELSQLRLGVRVLPVPPFRPTLEDLVLYSLLDAQLDGHLVPSGRGKDGCVGEVAHKSPEDNLNDLDQEPPLMEAEDVELLRKAEGLMRPEWQLGQLAAPPPRPPLLA